MSISIAISSFRRAAQLKNTLASIAVQTVRPDQIVIVEDGHDDQTSEVCSLFRTKGLPIEYYERKNRPNLSYSNPAVPKNIAIRKAVGDILIIQCAEVRYENPTDIENLIRPVQESADVTAVATVKALYPNGDFEKWYAGPARSATWFLDFCQAVRRDRVVAIGGFDEAFQGYGFDDDDFSFRLAKSGVRQRWAENVVCSHQWHPAADGGGTNSYYLSEISEKGRKYLATTLKAIEAGERSFVANVGKDWGNLES